jgi:hypothetical protein
MLHFVNWYTVTDVSKVRSTHIFSSVGVFDPESEGAAVLWIISDYLSVDMVQHHMT